jgi:hypothetical protein
MTRFVVRAKTGGWGKRDAVDGYTYFGGRDGMTSLQSATPFLTFEDAVDGAEKLMAVLLATHGASAAYAEIVENVSHVVGQVDMHKRVTDARAPDAADVPRRKRALDENKPEPKRKR